MQSTVLIVSTEGNLPKKESEQNSRISEKEKEGWEVIEMQVSPAAFGSGSKLVLRLVKE